MLPMIALGDTAVIQCSGGGSASHDNNTNNWATVHDAATGTGTDNSGGVYVMAAVSGGNYKVYRGFLSCNTASIPDTATITGATVEVKGSDKFGALSESYGLYNSTHVDPITTASYNDGGTTSWATPIALAAWSSSATNTWTLNATGVAGISLTGTTSIAVREKEFDVDNSAPSGSESGIAYLLNGTGYPVITVTYTDAGGGSSSSTASTSASELSIVHDPSQTLFNAYIIFLASFGLFVFYFRRV